MWNPRLCLNSAEPQPGPQPPSLQVDASSNTDKYYVLQALTAGSKYYLFTRWGRTGEKMNEAWERGVEGLSVLEGVQRGMGS